MVKVLYHPPLRFCRDRQQISCTGQRRGLELEQRHTSRADSPSRKAPKARPRDQGLKRAQRCSNFASAKVQKQDQGEPPHSSVLHLSPISATFNKAHINGQENYLLNIKTKYRFLHLFEYKSNRHAIQVNLAIWKLVVAQQWETLNTKYSSIKSGLRFNQTAVLHGYVQLKLKDK